MKGFVRNLVGKSDLFLGHRQATQQRQVGSEIRDVTIEGLNVPLQVQSIAEIKLLNPEEVSLCCLIRDGNIVFYRHCVDPTSLDTDVMFPSAVAGSWLVASSDSSLSIILVRVYKRSDTEPASPIGGSIQSSLIDVTIIPPAGWSTTIPSGTAALYTSSSNVTINIQLVGTSNTSIGMWSVPVELDITGTAGMPGASVRIIYIRDETIPTAPSNSADIPINWSDSIPEGTDILWFSIGQKSLGATEFIWSGPLRAEGQDGTSVRGAPGSRGSNGAGLYSIVLRMGVFPSNSVASNDFLVNFGRAPVASDVLIYFSADKTTSSTKTFDGTDWVPTNLIIPGSLILPGSIAGDKLEARIELTAPVIKGGRVQLVGDDYMKVDSAIPFGPDNLVEWFGPKNADTYVNNEVVLLQLAKANSIRFLGANGDAGLIGTTISNTFYETLSLGNTPSMAIEMFTSIQREFRVRVTFAGSLTYINTLSQPVAVVTPSFYIKSNIGTIATYSSPIARIFTIENNEDNSRVTLNNLSVNYTINNQLLLGSGDILFGISQIANTTRPLGNILAPINVTGTMSISIIEPAGVPANLRPRPGPIYPGFGDFRP